MQFDHQPHLQNNKVELVPLKKSDFEDLYKVASDPAIWLNHPNKFRYQKEIFRTFFEGAIKSEGAFKIIDKASGELIGSTRIYDYEPDKNQILIGYTFFATSHWGKGFNLSVKRLLLDYLFQFVSTVGFHIGATNFPSQKSIAKLGAVKVNEMEVTYFGEQPKQNFIYEITKEEWLTRKA